MSFKPPSRTTGLHHVAIAASDLEASVRFYSEALGMKLALRFPEGDQQVVMLDAGDHTYLELFSGGDGLPPRGSLMHLALRVADCDAVVAKARAAGATIAEEPTDMILEGDPPTPVRYAFVAAPDGVQVELMQCKTL